MIDFEAQLAEARRNRRCAECGCDLHHETTPRSAFCSGKHRYAFRDRRKYAEHPERERERARRYYAENREAVLERAAAKRGRPRPPERTTCSECGDPLEARRRVVCSRRRCKEARWRRLNPEAYQERERKRVIRRRETRRKARAA